MEGGIHVTSHYPGSYAPLFQVGDGVGIMKGFLPPLGGAFALIGEFYCTFVHLCSTDLMKSIAPVEGN